MCTAQRHLRPGDYFYVHEPTVAACATKVQVLSKPIGLPGAWSDVRRWVYARRGSLICYAADGQIGSLYAVS
jgi:hypothetical protein